MSMHQQIPTLTPSSRHHTLCLLFAGLLLLFGCGGSDSPTDPPGSSQWSPVAEETVGADGATVSGDDFSLEIPLGAFTEETNVQVGMCAADDHTLLDERLSPSGAVFRFTGLTEFTEPLTLELAFDPAKLASGDTLLVYFEEEMRGSGGLGWVQVGRPLADTEIDREAGVVRATIPPHVFADSDAKAEDDEIEFLVSVTSGDEGMLVTENELFSVHWQYGQVSQAWVDELMDDLFVARVALENLGAEYCGLLSDRVIVHVRPIADADGNFFQSKWGFWDSFLEFDVSLSGREKEVSAGHELFHLYQMCHGICGYFRGYDHKWLSEALSVWFEAILLEDPTYLSTVQNSNRGFITEGLEFNTANVGYGAAAFMTWLTEKYTNDLVREILVTAALNPNMPGAGARAVDTVLRDHMSMLSLEFRDFAQQFCLGATTHTNWLAPSPSVCALPIAAPTRTMTYDMMDISAQPILTALDTEGAPAPDGNLTITLPDGTAPYIEGFVYTSAENNGPWVSAGTVTASHPVIVEDFATGLHTKVKTVLVNTQGALPCTEVTQASITYAFAPVQDAYPADLFKMELQTEFTMASGIGSTGNRLFELRFPIEVSGNTFSAEWDTTYDNNNTSTGWFTCTVNAAHDALMSWSWSQDNYSPTSDVVFHKAASGTGPIPLVLLNDTNMKFSTDEGTGTCDFITTIEYSYRYRTSEEVLDEMTSYRCLHNSYFTLWLWDTSD